MEEKETSSVGTQKQQIAIAADKIDPAGIGGLEKPKIVANPIWGCELNTLSGEPLTTMTVGVRAMLSCRGDFVDGIKKPFEIFQMVPNPKEAGKTKKIKYHLVPLRYVSSSETDLKLEVTSYRVGQHKELQLQIHTGAGKTLTTSPMNWTVESVIKDPKQKPYGPMGPFKMSQPWWYYAIIIVTIVIVLGWLIRFLKRKLDRRKMIEDLARHGTALSPFNQLNKDLRKTSRKLGFYNSKNFAQEIGEEAIASISDEFKMFLVRQLKVPADQWSIREIMREIKKYHPRVYFERETDIRRLFAELEKAEGASDRISKRDCEQLMEMVRVVSEGITELKKRGAR